MRVTMVIPTYWSRENNEWKKGDVVYDHPTQINGKNTLERTLESMKGLTNREFKLVILICPTCDDIEEIAERKVRDIIGKVNLEIETYIFTQKNLKHIKIKLKTLGLIEDSISMLNMKGYSNVRNMCLYVAHILASEVVILIDDDEVFENNNFIEMATEFIGKRIFGKGIYGIAGYYLNKHNEFYDDVKMVPWMTYWDRFGSKTKAFNKIIANKPRIKRTPFAFGGLMVIHKNLYKIIPFDKDVTRGEDIDYLINAKMYGFDFFLDNKLNIKHLPPEKKHPLWKRFREDIYRFLYEQAKIKSQYEIRNMNKIIPEDFDPYPGDFLKDDLEDKIFKTNILLALEYLSEDNIEGCKESIKNIYISKYEAIPNLNPFEEYITQQKKWVKLIELTSKNRIIIRKIMESNNLTREKNINHNEKYINISHNEKIAYLRKFDDFKEFSEKDLLKITKITHLRVYDEDEVIFKQGDKNMEFMMVVSGCVRIAKFNGNNDEITLAIVPSKGMIGETSLINNKYTVYGIADEITEILAINSNKLKILIEEEEVLGKKILYVFLKRLYFKLNQTNMLYKDKVLKDENPIEMN